jgi:hypothetical protein
VPLCPPHTASSNMQRECSTAPIIWRRYQRHLWLRRNSIRTWVPSQFPLRHLLSLARTERITLRQTIPFRQASYPFRNCSEWLALPRFAWFLSDPKADWQNSILTLAITDSFQILTHASFINIFSSRTMPCTVKPVYVGHLWCHQKPPNLYKWPTYRK